VTRQYVASLGAAVNCQVGIAVVLAANAGGCPVNWRLTIPESWDRDAERRRQAHVPEHERHQPWWRYVLAALDETIDTWGLPPSPVLVDARHDPRPEPLLRGLEQRGLRYAVRVCGGAPTRQDGCTDSAQGIPARSSRYPTATDLAARMPTRSRVTLTWWDAERGRPGRSQFVLAPVSGESDVHSGVRGHPWLPSRHVVAEWSAGQAMPGAVWITNLNAPRLSELVELLRLRGQASRVLRRLADESGLRHFEGRSFRGWHHHVTLVSVAHAYRVLREVGFANRRARCPRGADGRRLTGHFRGYPDGTGGRHGAAGSCARATAARGAARVPV